MARASLKNNMLIGPWGMDMSVTGGCNKNKFQKEQQLFIQKNICSLPRIMQALCWVQGQKAKRWPSTWCAYRNVHTPLYFYVYARVCVSRPGRPGSEL